MRTVGQFSYVGSNSARAFKQVEKNLEKSKNNQKRKKKTQRTEEKNS